MKHLPENKKWRLTTYVLEGESYSKAGKRYGVSRSTARDICLAYFGKIVLPGEAELNGVDVKSKKSIVTYWCRINNIKLAGQQWQK